MPKLEHTRSVVIDTHVWVWTSAGDPRAAEMESYEGQCIVSAISMWEVAMLVFRGRLNVLPDVEIWLKANLEPPVLLEPISAAIASESCRLPEFHGDPADRLIVATALVLGVPLVTADEKIHDWNEKRRLLRLYSP